MKNVLTIAGSDSSGGAGIQADLKTMCALGVYGMSVITAITAQNTQKVFCVQEMTPYMVSAQIDAVFSDIPVHSVKIGMVSDSDIIRIIRDRLLYHGAKNIVLDPVMISKSGYSLLKPEAKAAVTELVSIADIVTPNIPEAEIISKTKINGKSDMEKAAKTILDMGARAVLIKGGHFSGDADDLLLTDKSKLVLKAPRIDTENTHGTGCTLSSAIACGLAINHSIELAVKNAKEYVTHAIKDSLNIGHGHGPLGHMSQLYKLAGMDLDSDWGGEREQA